MKWSIVFAAACLVTVRLVALDGQPGLHDPSTVIVENGKYYVYATGGGLPMSISDDGWTWRRAGGVMQAVPGGKPGPDVIARGGNNTWAPDVIRVGDKVLPLLLRAGHAAEVGDRPPGRQDTRSRVA